VDLTKLQLLGHLSSKWRLQTGEFLRRERMQHHKKQRSRVTITSATVTRARITPGGIQVDGTSMATATVMVVVERVVERAVEAEVVVVGGGSGLRAVAAAMSRHRASVNDHAHGRVPDSH